MSSDKAMTGEVYYPAPEVVSHAYVQNYEKLYADAEADLSAFWGRIAAENFEWYKPWNTVLDDSNAPFYKWYDGAQVNIVHNALDRHLRTPTRNKAALIFEGEAGIPAPTPTSN